MFDGNLLAACCIHKAKEWQIHLICKQFGERAFTRLHTELLQPIIVEAPSDANPMQLERDRLQLESSSLMSVNRFSAEAY